MLLCRTGLCLQSVKTTGRKDLPLVWHMPTLQANSLYPYHPQATIVLPDSSRSRSAARKINWIMVGVKELYADCAPLYVLCITSGDDRSIGLPYHPFLY